MSTINVYMNKDDKESLIEECGKELWNDSFNVINFNKLGNQDRLIYSVNDTNNKIDFYFKADGSVTIKSVGKENQFNDDIIKKIESKTFKNKHSSACCSFERIDDSIFNRILSNLNQNDKVILLSDSEIENPKHRSLKYQSAFGDRVTINRYPSGTITFQGNPAYLFSQLMFIMSEQDNITEDEINKKQKEVYKSNISVNEARNVLKERLPNSYDKLSEEIKKLISPSISLSQSSNLEVEEYSCYVFPALKGLEALLLDLLFKKSIILNINKKKGDPGFKNFSEIFEQSVPGDKMSRYNVRNNIKAIISDSVYCTCLEDIYGYFRMNRHVIFHAEQVLSLTKMIFSKSEADVILNDVLELIDDVLNKII